MRIARIALLLCTATGCASPGPGFKLRSDAGDDSALGAKTNAGDPDAGGQHDASSNDAAAVVADGATADLASCAEAQRLCAHTFSFTGTGVEQRVELRGDYRTGAWSTGDLMTASNSSYSVSIPLPFGGTVRYKFYILLKAGGERWLADPTNPKSESDGLGGLNSLLDVGNCPIWTCRP